MRIYMDVCCLNRPFDDLSQARVNLEAEAVLSILSQCERGDWTLFSSGAIDFELSRLPNVDKLAKIKTLYRVANERAEVSSTTERRASELQQSGLKILDSYHVATAEDCGADVFLTTDDRLQNTANRMELKVRVSNPAIWLMEVTANER